MLCTKSFLGGGRSLLLIFECILVVRGLILSSEWLKEFNRLLHGLHDLLLLKHLLELPFGSTKLLSPLFVFPHRLLLGCQILLAPMLRLCERLVVLWIMQLAACVKARLTHLPLAAYWGFIVDCRLLAIPQTMVAVERSRLCRLVGCNCCRHQHHQSSMSVIANLTFLFNLLGCLRWRRVC